MAMADTSTNKHGQEQEVPDLKELALDVVSQHIISLENVKLKLNLITDMVLTVMVMVLDMDMEDTDMPVMDTTGIILERDLPNPSTDTHMPMDSILMLFVLWLDLSQLLLVQLALPDTEQELPTYLEAHKVLEASDQLSLTTDTVLVSMVTHTVLALALLVTQELLLPTHKEAYKVLAASKFTSVKPFV